MEREKERKKLRKKTVNEHLESSRRINPPASKGSREIENLTARKNTHNACLWYQKMCDNVCLSMREALWPQFSQAQLNKKGLKILGHL